MTRVEDPEQARSSIAQFFMKNRNRLSLCCHRSAAKARVLLILLTALLIAEMFSPSSAISRAQAQTAEGVSDGFAFDGSQFSDSDWPWWRGPRRNGTSSSKQNPPIEFDESENVVWKAKVEGRGHSSPTVVGDHVFLATSMKPRAQAVVCFDRSTGEQLWQTTVHDDGSMVKNGKATPASSTVACDGERLYIAFPNNGALIASCLSIDGELLWQREIAKYKIHQGYGSSPALYQNLVIVTADNKLGGAIAALDRQSGDLIWRRDRPAKPNYPSPTILNVGGKDQIVMIGCDKIESFDPLTGKTNWETSGGTTESVTSTVTDGSLVYSSGGYPRNHVSAIKADGSSELVWENNSRVYVPSLLIKDDYLYGILDAGIAVCWKADSGKEMWKKRLGGNFTSSPVLVGDKIYAVNESGEFFVFNADPKEFSQLAKNKLGDESFATPTIVGGKIYHRVAKVDGKGDRQEWLYCLAN